MRKTNYLKSLLIAVALLVGGSSAWADATSIYERGTTNAWTANDVAEGAWSAGTIGTNGLEVTNGVASSILITPTSNVSLLTWTVTWNPGNATGTANNTNAYISFGDVTFKFYGSSWRTDVTIGGTTTQLSGGGATRGRDYVITVTINQSNNKVNYVFNDNGTEITGSGITAKAGSFTTLTHGLGGKSPNWTNTSTLKKVEITEEETEVLSYGTIITKYQLEDGTALCEDVMEDVDLGEKFTPVTKSFVSKYYDYTYKEGADEIASVSGNATINIVYTKSLKAEYADYNILFVEDYVPVPTTATGWSTSTGGRYDPIIAESNGDYYMTVNQANRNNNGATVTGTTLTGTAEAGADFTLLFDIQLGAAKDRTSDITKFTLNDAANSAAILSFTASATGSTTWKINDSETATVTMAVGTWYSVKLTRKGAKTYLTITKRDDNSIAFSYSEIPTLSENGGLGKMILITNRYYANLAMDNFLVRDVVSSEDIIYLYSVKAVAGEEEIALLASGTTDAGNEYSVVLNQVISVGGKYYVLDEESVSNYKLTYTMPDGDDNHVVNYKEDPTIIYYTEGTPTAYMNEVVPEEGGEAYSGGTYMTTNTSANHGNARNRGYGLGNLAAGQYEITASIVNNNGRRICVRTDAGGYNGGNEPLVTISGKGLKTGAFALGSVKNVVITGPNSGTADGNKSTHMEDFDYIIIRKVSDVAAEYVKVSNAGYATYYSENALDFTATGLTAYIAKVENNMVTFEPVTTIPANTGVLLKGEANTYTVPVIESSNTDVSTNAFNGSLIYVKVEDTGIFVLMNNDEGVGFYKTANAFTIGAHTAYLPASVAAARFIGLDATATGISDASRLMNNEKMNKELYNLQGQRVAGAQPKKGLYIQEGRKVIIK